MGPCLAVRGYQDLHILLFLAFFVGLERLRTMTLTVVGAVAVSFHDIVTFLFCGIPIMRELSSFGYEIISLSTLIFSLRFKPKKKFC